MHETTLSELVRAGRWLQATLGLTFAACWMFLAPANGDVTCGLPKRCQLTCSVRALDGSYGQAIPSVKLKVQVSYKQWGPAQEVGREGSREVRKGDPTSNNRN